MASYGDIHFTPFYDTTYQHHHGYNERNLAAKSNHWDREYSLHAPTATRIRNRFIVKPGRYEVGRTLSQDAQVAQVLQSRTALIGEDYFDGSTKNSLAVESRFGASQKKRSELPWPQVNTQRSIVTPQQAWSNSTVPTDRTSSLRMRGASSVLRHPSFKRTSAFSGSIGGAADTNDTTAPWCSRQGVYDSEYTSTYCSVKNQQAWTTNRQDFFEASLRSFQDPVHHPLDASSHVHKVERPSTPTQPLDERKANEKISMVGLESMQRPVHRKTYPQLAEYPITFRPQPYNFDMNYHIQTMRPSPLFQDRSHHEWVSEKRQEKDILLQIQDRELQTIGQKGQTFNSHQLTATQ